MRSPLFNNIAPYLGIIPATAVTVAAAAQPDPDTSRQLIEVVFAALSIAASIVLPWMLQKLKKLGRELKSTPSNQDVSVLAAKVGELEAQILNLQDEIKSTAQERDQLRADAKDKDVIFQETILKLKNDSYEQVQNLSHQLRDERALNASLSRQYDELISDFKALKQEVAGLRGMNDLAEMIRNDIRNIIKGA